MHTPAPCRSGCKVQLRSTSLQTHRHSAIRAPSGGRLKCVAMALKEQQPAEPKRCAQALAYLLGPGYTLCSRRQHLTLDALPRRMQSCHLWRRHRRGQHRILPCTARCCVHLGGEGGGGLRGLGQGRRIPRPGLERQLTGGCVETPGGGVRNSEFQLDRPWDTNTSLFVTHGTHCRHSAGPQGFNCTTMIRRSN